MVAQLALVHYCLAIEVQPIPRHHLFLLASWVTGPGKGKCKCSDQCKRRKSAAHLRNPTLDFYCELLVMLLRA